MREFDYIVVGGGTWGCVSSRLNESYRRLRAVFDRRSS